MKRTPTLLTALLLTPLALHAAEPITNSLGMKLMPIKPGTFTMGQDGPPLEDYLRQKRFGEMPKDIDRIDFHEKPAHFNVTVSYDEGKTWLHRIQIITSKGNQVFDLALIKALSPAPKK